jgi:hypothetical protein
MAYMIALICKYLEIIEIIVILVPVIMVDCVAGTQSKVFADDLSCCPG